MAPKRSLCQQYQRLREPERGNLRLGLRSGIENDLDVGAELLALGEHLVEILLSEYRAKRGLRKHVGRRMKFCTLMIGRSELTMLK
jgi:hypothetical protein